MSLESRLKRLEEIVATKCQQQVNQSESDRLKAAMERVAAMDDAQILAEYNAFINAPPSPEIEAQLAGKTCEDLIKDYIELCK
jgi:hypothetical protein